MSLKKFQGSYWSNCLLVSSLCTVYNAKDFVLFLKLLIIS